MSYNRGNAIDYAQTYWTIPCKDGLLGLRDDRPSIESFRHQLHAPAADWKALFVRDDTGTERGVFRKSGEPDKVFQGWDGLDDCAHYVSQCLRAGGAAIETQWGARELKERLQALPNTKTLVEKASVDAGQRIVDAGLLKKGDAVIYYKSVPSEESHVGYGHSAMYVGDGGITCHSTCRYKGLGDSTDDEWHLNDGAIFLYTLIHFSTDDAVEADVSKALTGWWSVEYAGRTSYYAVLTNGSARKSQTPPRRPTDQPPAGPSAYWFQDQNSIKFTWKETGDLEDWTVNSANIVVKSKLNDISGKVTKLF
jgi:hypothetical protein